MRQIHFNQILIFAPITHMLMTWTDPSDQHADGMQSFQYWKDVARIVERGCFDGIFFADVMTVPDDFKEGVTTSIELGASYPRHDPLALIPIMADATRHIGFGVTLSTAGTPPYLTVRRIGTLDNLTGGRVAWNVVTSHIGSDSRALGLPQLGHDERYDVADEYMEICYRLWDAFPVEAFLYDRAKRRFADPDKIRRVDYQGKYLSCSAYPVMKPSPQGRPLVFQAGQSGRGMKFAARHADAVYSLHARLETMRKFVENIRTAAEESGKAAPPVFFGIQPILGGTESEAKARQKAFLDAIPLPAAIGRLSGMIGVDLGRFDPDQPLEELDTQASRGLLAATLESMEGRRPTIREAALHWGMCMGMQQLVGTPEQVADRIVALWQGSGAYGFNISPTISPGSICEFVDQVVPILQRKGLMRTAYSGTTFRHNLAH